MTFMTSGLGPARRRARHMAGGVAVAGLLAAAAVGSGGTGAAAAVTPGSLDTAFGTGGIVTASLSALGAGGEQAALQEPNGDIVVALSQGVLRFLPNGELDTSFGSNGLATGILIPSLPALAVQPNGQIIISGVNLANSPTVSQTVGITRLNANGTVDTTFGTDGTTSVPVTLAGTTKPFGPTAALVQPDGKILVTGTASVQTGHRTGISDGVVARLNANGTVDTSFGAGGSVLITANPFPTGLGLDAAGDIFALPGQAGVPPQPGVTELSPAGQLDATVTPQPLTATSAGATVDRNDEQFVFPQSVSLGSETLLSVEIQRYSTAGTLASSTGAFAFAGTPGTVRDTPSVVTVMPNGQALLLGTHATGATVADEQAAVQAFALANPDGTLDSSFGTGGTALTSLNLTSGGFSALFPQSDGTVIAVGEGTVSPTQSGLVIARFNL